MQFDKLVEQLLTEMPHMLVNNKMIDLEIENHAKTKDYKGLLDKIKRIYNGEKYTFATKHSTDGTGTTIQLTTPEERQEFLKKVKLNHMLKGFVPGDLIDSL